MRLGQLPCALAPANCKGFWDSEAALAAPPAGGRQAAFLSPRLPAAIPTVQVSLRDKKLTVSTPVLKWEHCMTQTKRTSTTLITRDCAK